MSARIKCIARKVLHALNVNGQWVAVSQGFMLATDVDRSKFTCNAPTPLPAPANRNQVIESRTDAILAGDPMLATWEHGKVVHVLRAIGHALYVLTIGG